MPTNRSTTIFFAVVWLAATAGCDEARAPDLGSDAAQTASARQPSEQRDRGVSVTVPFHLTSTALPGTPGPTTLEPGCIKAMDYQNQLELTLLKGKILMQQELAKMTGKDPTQSTATTRSPMTATITFNGTNSDLRTGSQSKTVGSGGSSTLAAGSVGGTASGVTVQAPSSTTVDSDGVQGSLTLSFGASLSQSLGNTVVITNIPITETHPLREFLNSLYRTPQFCAMMKECKGLQIAEKNHDTAVYCGGGSFTFSGGSGGGGPGGPGGGGPSGPGGGGPGGPGGGGPGGPGGPGRPN